MDKLYKYFNFRRVKKNSLIKQHDITDCGAACLASVSAFYNQQLPIARIRQFASTNKQGTNVLGMVEAAERLGFKAKGVKGPKESLQKIPKPAIAHVIVKEHLQHYVVIYDATEKYVTIMDPADGRLHKSNINDFTKEWTGYLIILFPNESFKQENLKVSTFHRFWVLLAPHKSILVQAFAGAIVYTLLGLFTSVFIQQITDRVLPESNLNLLNLLSVVAIILLMVQLLIGVFKSIFALKTGQRIDSRLILGYYKHLLTLPQNFFDTMRIGEIISRVNDAVKIRSFINDVALNLVVNVLVVLFSFGLMFSYYWKLGLMMLATIPIYGLIYFVVNNLNRTIQRTLMEDTAALETKLVESIGMATTIKRFGAEYYTNACTESTFFKLLRTVYKSSKNAIYTGTADELVSKLFTIILLWVGSYFAIQREITPGELMSFYALIGYFTGPAGQLITANKTLQDALIAADRLFEIMDLEQEENSEKIELTLEMLHDIRFRQVSFRYGSRAQIFEQLDLHIPKGKISAIVGESGSGKTSLISLLQNLYPVQKGNITIGDLDIRHIRNDSLRRKVVVVPQQIDLLAGNIVENIAFGIFEPDLNKIVLICHELGLLEFIQQLPKGFDTEIGENGTTLSGGQRQRLAMARALYREPEILILDEATSSLDSISEHFVQNAVWKLRTQGKTVIIIAHRLSTIREADKIMVLQKGQLIEEGTHENLLNNKATYFDLWQIQHPVN